MAGFYAFALAMVAALLWVPYAELRYVHRVHFQLTAVCLGADGTILWSLVPRRDRFEPPGPPLEPESQPKLFAVIDEVAAATGERSPDEVYLVNQVNAWVAERGGVMGFRSRRVMGVGLPLLQTLSLAEFRAVVAHEFGHYRGGDVKLGPWIYRTRATIGRTIAGMHDTMLQAPFLWYGKQFLKLTHAVSRQQEFVADGVAAAVAGAGAQASALRRVTAAAVAFDAYMRTELLPVVRAGYLPPVAEGFDQFNRVPGVSAKLAEVVQHAEGSANADPFDTHPSLRERLAALGETPVDDRREPVAAMSLITNVEGTARSLLEHTWGDENVRGLRPLRWEDVGESVYATEWRAVAARHAAWLAQFTAERIPASDRELMHAGSDLVAKGESNVDADECTGRAVYVISAGLACLLLDRGWKAETGPGQALELANGPERISPSEIVQQLRDARLSPEAWSARCENLGIAGTPFGPATPA